MTRGDVVKFGRPIGQADKEMADAKGDRCAVVLGRTAPHGYLRIEFYGDATGHSCLVHPESLVMVYSHGRKFDYQLGVGS